MKKFLLLMVILVGVLCGCRAEEPGAEYEPPVEESRVEEVKPPVEEEPEVEDRTFGLNEKEIAYIEDWLSSCSLNATWADLTDVDCLGYCRIPMADGERVDYSKKTYALIFKDGNVILVNIPVEESA